MFIQLRVISPSRIVLGIPVQFPMHTLNWHDTGIEAARVWLSHLQLSSGQGSLLLTNMLNFWSKSLCTPPIGLLQVNQLPGSGWFTYKWYLSEVNPALDCLPITFQLPKKYDEFVK